jgi:prevent-host-death family protein
MVTMTVSEARARLPEVLDRVEVGEEVTITRHGQPAAVVVRPDIARARRLKRLNDEVEQLRREREEARHRPISETKGLTREFAEDLIAEIRAGRNAR